MRPDTRTRRAWFLLKVPVRGVAETAWTGVLLAMVSFLSGTRRNSLPLPYGGLVEQRRDRGLYVDALDRAAQQAGDGANFNLADGLGGVGQRNGVGDDQLFETGLLNTLDRRAGEHGVGGAGIDGFRALREQGVCGFDQGAGGVDDVVKDEAGAVADVANNVHHFGHVDVGAALVDDGERHLKLLGEEAGAFHATGVRAHDREVGERELAEVVDQNRRGEEVIDGDVEEALNLRGMEVDEKRAV